MEKAPLRTDMKEDSSLCNGCRLLPILASSTSKLAVAGSFHSDARPVVHEGDQQVRVREREMAIDLIWIDLVDTEMKPVVLYINL